MLTRAISRREVSLCVTLLGTILTSATAQAISEFVLELGLKESNSEKWQKVTSLALSDEEWTCVRLFCNILQVRITTTCLNVETTDV